MTGISYQAWRLCGIAFMLLLPYVIWKRRLWFPGLAAIGLGVFGGIKFWPAMGGSLRVWNLLLVGGVFIVLFILLEKRWRPGSGHLRLGSLEKAPIFLMALLFLLLFRIVCEYIYSGEYFFQRVIRDFIISTLLPCIIILIHPPREDGFKEILKGIGLGAFLVLLPAFTDVETFRGVWNAISGGYVIGQYDPVYRGKCWAQMAIHVGIVLVYLCVFNIKRRKYYMPAAAICFMIAVVPLSRRWFVSMSCFLVLFSFWWIKISRRSKRTNLVIGVLILCFAVSLTWFVESHFKRHSYFTMVAELGPSSMVRAGYSRFDLWKYTLKEWLEKPVVGRGYLGYGWVVYEKEAGTGAVFSRHIGAHNIIMDLLVKTGLIGALLGIIFLKQMFSLLRKWFKLSKGNERFFKELSLLSIYWVSLFPAAIFGGCNIDTLGLIAILPCAIRFVILNHAGTVRSTIGQKDGILATGETSPKVSV